MDDASEHIADLLASVNDENINRQYKGCSLLHLCFTNVTLYQHQIETILNLGIDVNLQNDLGETALMTCPYPGKVLPVFVDSILDKTNISLTNLSGWTLMHYACKYGNTKLITELLKRFGEETLYNKTHDGTSALGFVSQVETVKVILDFVKEFKFSYDITGKSELQRYLEISNEDVIEFLLRKPISPPSDMSDIIDIIITKGNEKLFKIVTQFYNDSITRQNVCKAIQLGFLTFLYKLTEGKSASLISSGLFFEAIKAPSNSLKMFEYLQANIKEGITWQDLAAKLNDREENLAYFCCSYNQTKILDVILDKTPGLITKPNKDGIYPLYSFLTYNHPRFIQTSVQLSAMFSKLHESSDLYPDLCKATTNIDLLSACVATCTESLEALKSLLDGGVPVFEDVLGRNVFHLVVLHHKKCTALSLLLGASPSYKEWAVMTDKLGLSPADYALMLDKSQMLKTFKENVIPCTSANTDAILQWLIREREMDNEDLEDVLGVINIPAPDADTSIDVSNISNVYKTFKDPVKVTFSENIKEPLFSLHNILIFNISDISSLNFTNIHHVDTSRDAMYRFHPISLALISYSDKKYFDCLPNKRVVVAIPDSSPASLRNVRFARFFAGAMDNTIIILTTESGSIPQLRESFPDSFVDLAPGDYGEFISKLGMKGVNAADVLVPDILATMEADEMSKVTSGTCSLESYIDTGLIFYLGDMYFLNYYQLKGTVVQQIKSSGTSLVIPEFSIWYYDFQGWYVDLMIGTRPPPPPNLKPHLQIKVKSRSTSCTVTLMCFEVILEILFKDFMLIPRTSSQTTLIFNQRRKLSLNLYQDVADHVISALLSSESRNTAAGSDIGVRQSDLQQMLTIFWRIGSSSLFPSEFSLILGIPCKNSTDYHYKWIEVERNKELPHYNSPRTAVVVEEEGGVDGGGAAGGTDDKEPGGADEDAEQQLIPSNNNGKGELEAAFQHDSTTCKERSVEALFDRPPVTGGSKLYHFPISTLDRVLTQSVKQRYIRAYGNSIPHDVQNFPDTGPSQWMYRLIALKNPSYRGMCISCKLSEHEKQLLCSAAGIPVKQSNSRLANCWALNKLEIIVFVLSIVIVVALLVLFDQLGVDLDTFGVAGVVAISTVSVILTRVFKSCSYTNYSNLPDIPME